MAAVSGVAYQRLLSERKKWRKDHPFGFVAKPLVKPDGSTNMLHWQCRIPGKAGTIWEGGMYPLDLIFSEEYPSAPPVAKFPPGFFHPNCYETGKVCLSIINAADDKGTWRPAVSVKMILTGIAELLDNPNIGDPAQRQAYDVYKLDRAKYTRLVKDQAKKYSVDKFVTAA